MTRRELCNSYIPSVGDKTCLHPEGILTIATVAFVARALQTLALHNDSLPSNTHLGTKSVVWQIRTLNL